VLSKIKKIKGEGQTESRTLLHSRKFSPALKCCWLESGDSARTNKFWRIVIFALGAS
jgi:hypothetical protein